MTDTKTEYYQDIHNLPLNKFIDCIVDGNLSALTISGFPSPEQLSQAWDFILSQYSELVGTQEYRMYKILYCEVSILKITLDQIRILAAKGNNQGEKVGILRMIENDFFASELNKLLNMNCKFNWADQKNYHEELDKCVRRSKALFIQYELKTAQFKAIEKKNQAKPGAKMDRQYFVSILVTLSDAPYTKYPITDNIKMSEYCERIKRYSDYCETVKKQT